MKITAIITAIFLAGISAHAAEARGTQRRRVTVCTEYSFEPVVRERAQLLATRIFAQAGVALDWRGLQSCPGDGLKIAFTTRTPEDRSPYDLAYARPFEGTHIEIFYDRVRTRAVATDRLLAHVMVHEITHMLQGSDHHAERGIMSARWTPMDYWRMEVTTLPFTPADLLLIQSGLAARDVIRGAGRPVENKLVLPSC